MALESQVVGNLHTVVVMDSQVVENRLDNQLVEGTLQILVDPDNQLVENRLDNQFVERTLVVDWQTEASMGEANST